ncbi:hypothetical protein GCM10009678_87970 [Actinomadura kijaniata]|uniref:Uncharacterized protein n=1 Tax=Actinomadura namibiensis TaxID=182080 RepID=A0A7W3LKR0_ACTNM|nr:hypothetical protein [Actinomadura namibiensis]MBA8949862.1 hypothetical protein [Actinomadura namibiensis]
METVFPFASRRTEVPVDPGYGAMALVPASVECVPTASAGSPPSCPPQMTTPRGLNGAGVRRRWYGPALGKRSWRAHTSVVSHPKPQSGVVFIQSMSHVMPGE